MFVKSLRVLIALTLALTFCALMVPTADAGPLFGPTDGSWLSSVPWLGNFLAWFDGLFEDEMTSLSAGTCEENPEECDDTNQGSGWDLNG